MGRLTIQKEETAAQRCLGPKEPGFRGLAAPRSLRYSRRWAAGGRQGPNLTAASQVGRAPCSLLYIVKGLHKMCLKKDDGEEKRMPAEFFPLTLIFHRCAFSVSIPTTDGGTAPRVRRQPRAPWGDAAVSACAEHSGVSTPA